MIPSKVDKEMEVNISWTLPPNLHYECQIWPSVRALALSSSLPDNLEPDHSYLKAKLLIIFSQKKFKTCCGEKSNLEEQIYIPGCVYTTFWDFNEADSQVRESFCLGRNSSKRTIKIMES